MHKPPTTHLAARTASAQSNNAMNRPSSSIWWSPPSGWLGLVWALVLCGLLLPQGTLGQAAEVEAVIERGQQAGLDVDQLQTVAERAQERGLDSEAVIGLLEPAVELAEQDLPAAPLLNKTLEGMAKQVPPAQMQPVIQQVRGYTEQAGHLVSGWTQRSDVRQMTGDGSDLSGENEVRSRLVTAAAEAQQQDIPLENLEQFLDELPAATDRRPVTLSEVAVAVSVLPDLPGSRSAPEATQQLLMAALDANYSAESLRQLPAAIESAQRETPQPVEALTRGTAQAITQGTPATQVLQSLFQGSVPGGGPPGEVGNGPPGGIPGSGKPPGKGGRPPDVEPPGDTPADPPPGGDGPPDTGGG